MFNFYKENKKNLLFITSINLLIGMIAIWQGGSAFLPLLALALQIPVIAFFLMIRLLSDSFFGGILIIIFTLPFTLLAIAMPIFLSGWVYLAYLVDSHLVDPDSPVMLTLLDPTKIPFAVWFVIAAVLAGNINILNRNVSSWRKDLGSFISPWVVIFAYVPLFMLVFGLAVEMPIVALPLILIIKQFVDLYIQKLVIQKSV